MRHAPRRFVLSAIAVSLALIEAPAGPALAAVHEATGPAADAPCGPAWTTTTSKDVSSTNNLYGIDGVAPNDVWAVGDSSEDEVTTTLVEHWTGSKWSIVPSPNVPPGSTSLTAVSMLSATSGWAVGGYSTASEVHRTLAMRWNGTSWSIVSSPNPSSEDNDLKAVAVVATNDVWAVGTYLPALGGALRTLVLHWNGSAWSVVASPNVGTGSNYLTGVAARSANDAWAVGHYYDTASDREKTLILKWNGSNWATVTSPNPSSGDNYLNGVTVLPGSTSAWAVGWALLGGIPKTLIAKYGGASWATQTSANPGTLNNALNGVAAAATGDVTSVGTFASANLRQPLAEHFNGSAWTSVSTPFVGSKNSAFVNNTLASVAVIGSQVWTAGTQFIEPTGLFTLAERLCPVQVLSSGFSPATSTVVEGATVHWAFPVANTGNHTIVENSAMSLFSSGSKAPGMSYTFTFVGAGTYTVRDTVTSKTSTINVPVVVAPQSGNQGTTFTVTWASASAPAGFVFDTQIKRPGGAWADWKIGKTGVSATFKADAGNGTYQFRSRLRKTANGAFSGWSPLASIVVS
jgi:plastocyanin